MIKTVPMTFRLVPAMIFGGKVSPRKRAANIRTNATLNLSTGVTWETYPNWRALK